MLLRMTPMVCRGGAISAHILELVFFGSIFFLKAAALAIPGLRRHRWHGVPASGLLICRFGLLKRRVPFCHVFVPTVSFKKTCVCALCPPTQRQIPKRTHKHKPSQRFDQHQKYQQKYGSVVACIRRNSMLAISPCAVVYPRPV